ncbi:zinc finger MYM-type protein 5-like isoform X2 [Diabrotica virgifera virgifera]|uniref:Zinc finger MYM-type protein 5-like n=1 Tax=Diabrotica virgifera virgifera TaxID=50390 RepID=A0ABM5KKL1_DIAVI|nr:zinc finger MYM-type protein 5-like isoform X2 [Diabrotica virgifera virgifera]
MGPKKPSGSEFKKIRNRKEQDNKKLASALGNWLKNENTSHNPGPSEPQIQDEEEDDEEVHGRETHTEDFCKSNMVLEDPTSHITPIEIDTNLEESSGNCSSQQIEYEDPRKWPTNFRLDTVRCKIVEKGPQMINLENHMFPYSDDGRRFSQKWVYKTLPNGENVKRQWLLYSQSKDVLFCFPCLLFSKDDKKDKSVFLILKRDSTIGDT